MANRLTMEVEEAVYFNFAKKKLVATFATLAGDIVCFAYVSIVAGVVFFLGVGAIMLYLEGLENLIANAKVETETKGEKKQ